MKKNLLLVTLLLISIFSMLFAKIKASEATKQREFSATQEQEIMRLKEEAEEHQQRAEVEAAEALKQMQRAEAALADCQGS